MTVAGPAVLSLLAGPDVDQARTVLDAVPGVARLRLLPGKVGDLGPWLALFSRVRISIDVDDATAGAVDMSDPRIRQVRWRLQDPDPATIAYVVRTARPPGVIRPVVVLLPATVLLQDPDPWSSAVSGVAALYLNIGPEGASVERERLASGLARWSHALVRNLFVSLPALAAYAGVAPAACDVVFGLHAYLDFERSLAGSCDCREPGIPLDSAGTWIQAWRGELDALAAASGTACAGCPLWRECRGGCPRAVGERDRVCPWPVNVFGQGDQ